MANTRAKEISESYKATEITFDKNVAGAVAKGFTATDVQSAIIESKPVAANNTTVGIVRAATDVEASLQASVNAYVNPAQVYARIYNFWTNVIAPAIPPPTTLPPVVYGGSGSVDQMVAIFAAYPNGSIVVFDEYYTYVVGWGNGSSVVGGYRRRTITRTSNAGWQFLHFA
ncbi:hypothetical protein D3C76_428520 [compost metagenome]